MRYIKDTRMQLLCLERLDNMDKLIYYPLVVTIACFIMALILIPIGAILKNDMLFGVGMGLTFTALSSFTQLYIAKRVDYLFIEHLKTNTKGDNSKEQ